jgi:hypothetical protein
MRCLFLSPQNRQWMGTMTNQYKGLTAARRVNSETAEGPGPRDLVVNVIFTDPEGTALALETAGSLAGSLGASIQLLAAQAVPYRLPLDEPQVSVRFAERLLSDLVDGLDQDAFETSARLYLCRNRLETLMRVLRPNSLVVIGGRKRWWPTAASRMARALRSKGHQVVFIDLRSRTASEPQ